VVFFLLGRVRLGWKIEVFAGRDRQIRVEKCGFHLMGHFGVLLSKCCCELTN
jgi:hypothetical protein